MSVTLKDVLIASWTGALRMAGVKRLPMTNASIAGCLLEEHGDQALGALRELERTIRVALAEQGEIRAKQEQIRGFSAIKRAQKSARV